MNAKLAREFSVQLAGVGRGLPQRRVFSSDLERTCGLPDGWCLKNNGVVERRWATTETSTELGAVAVREALEEARLELNEIQLLINASTSGEQLIPDGSAMLLRSLGLSKGEAAGFSLHTTCTSFVTGLDVAACLVGSGRYDNAVIVSSEVCSGFIHPSVPETYTLIGDGAAAAVLVRTPPGQASRVHGAIHKTYGYGAEFAQLKFGSKSRPHDGTVSPDDFIFQMSGTSIIKFGGRFAPQVVEELMTRCATTTEDVECFVTHQASQIALNILSLNFSERKLIRIIKDFGNCGCASVPMALYEAVRSGRVRRGTRMLVTGPGGAGMTIAGVLLTY